MPDHKNQELNPYRKEIAEIPTVGATGLGLAIQMVTTAKEVIPEPAKGAVAALGYLLTLLQTYLQNKADLKEIAESCVNITLIIERATRHEASAGASDILEAAAHLQAFAEKMAKDIRNKQKPPGKLGDFLKWSSKKSAKRRAFAKVLDIQGEKNRITGLKEGLNKFIGRFQLENSLTMSLEIRAIYTWIKAQEKRQNEGETIGNKLHTPARPAVFYGRDSIVKDIVNTLLLPDPAHIALLGPGGIGKTSIAKAILSEEHISTVFSARVLVTYDNVDYSQMTYDTFLKHIGKALRISDPTNIAILNYLESLESALIVIDNAETFIEAGNAGLRDISKMLEDMGAHCRIIFTTRNTDTVPTNLRWKRISVERLDAEAAGEAFMFVYSQEFSAGIDIATKNLLHELDYHPLSINILASAAVSNKWTLAQLEMKWKTQRKSSILEIRKDRYHSVGFAIDLSVSCSDFDETRDQVMKLLRAVAFLPRGIHRQDLEGVLEDNPAISIAESLCRCSLTYWRDDRLVVLSPIRMHIMEKYNQYLVYNDNLIESIRRNYYLQIDYMAGHCAREEHANLDRVLLFDMSQEFVQVGTLQYLRNFAIELYNHNPQPMSVWSSLERAQSEADLDTFNEAKASTMIWVSALYGKMDHNRTFLEMIEATEQFCRHTDGLKSRLAECICDKGNKYRYLGKIAEAETCLREAHAIVQELGDAQEEASVYLSLSYCAIRRGDLLEATVLLDLAESYRFDPTYQAWTDILLNRAQVALLQGNLDQARSEIARAMESDEACHGGRRRFRILNRKADVEARAGTPQATGDLFAEVTATEVFPGQPYFFPFLMALHGQAYYAALAGDIDWSKSYAARALLLASEGRSNDSYRKSLLISGYIEMFTHEYSKARDHLHSALTATDAESLSTTAIVYRALGEVAALEKDMEGAQKYLSKIDSLSDEMGIPARCIYNTEVHWYTLPDDRFPAWSLYVTRHQSQT